MQSRLNIDRFFNFCNKFLLVEAQTSSFFKTKNALNWKSFFKQVQKKIFQHTTVAIFSTPNFSAWVVHRYMKTMQNVWPIVLASL
jgi:hypothetical protein